MANPALAKQAAPTSSTTRTIDKELFANDPLLSAIGIGKELWADEHADEYVARLRKEWEVARYFWDTNHCIYLFEGNELFGQAAVKLRLRILIQGNELLTSSMTLGEIQVKSLKDNHPELAADLKRRVLESSEVVSFDTPAADAFAFLRATTKIKGADAIHLACAMAAGVDFFVTNDADLYPLKFSGIGRIISAQLMTRV